MKPMLLLLLLLLLLIVDILIVNQIVVVLSDTLYVGIIYWQTVAEQHLLIISIFHELNYGRLICYGSNFRIVVLQMKFVSLQILLNKSTQLTR